MAFLLRLRRSVSSLLSGLDKDFQQAHVRAIARMPHSDQVTFVTSLVQRVRQLETEVKLADTIWREFKESVAGLSKNATQNVREFAKTKSFNHEEWQHVAGMLAEADHERRRFKREFL